MEEEKVSTEGFFRKYSMPLGIVAVAVIIFLVVFRSQLREVPRMLKEGTISSSRRVAKAPAVQEIKPPEVKGEKEGIREAGEEMAKEEKAPPAGAAPSGAVSPAPGAAEEMPGEMAEKAPVSLPPAAPPPGVAKARPPEIVKKRSSSLAPGAAVEKPLKPAPVPHAPGGTGRKAAAPSGLLKGVKAPPPRASAPSRAPQVAKGEPVKKSEIREFLATLSEKKARVEISVPGRVVIKGDILGALKEEKEEAIPLTPPPWQKDLVVTAETPVVIGGHEIPVKKLAEILSAPGSPAKQLFGLRIVQPGDNIWNIHYGVIRRFFREKRHIELPEHVDEPHKDGTSSGVGKILKFSEKIGVSYNMITGKIRKNPDLLIPGQEIYFYRMADILDLLEGLTVEELELFRFDGVNLIFEGSDRLPPRIIEGRG